MAAVYVISTTRSFRLWKYIKDIDNLPKDTNTLVKNNLNDSLTEIIFKLSAFLFHLTQFTQFWCWDISTNYNTHTCENNA